MKKNHLDWSAKEIDPRRETSSLSVKLKTEPVAVVGRQKKWRNDYKMSSISQSVLMALTVTVNEYASSNIHAVRRRGGKRSAAIPATKAAADARTASATTATAGEIGRRAVLLSAVVGTYPPNDSRTELLNKYLKKSEENKAKNDKERLDSYYRRNYKDYFDILEGTLRGKKEEDLTESEKGILDWLKNNK